MKKVSRIRFLLVAIAALMVWSAQAKEYFFEVLNPKNDVSESITSVFVVPNGYAWGATENGLIRLDYYNFKYYKADGAEGSIPGNIVYTLGTDHNNVFWITTNAGLAQYDRTADTFKTYMVERGGHKVPVMSRSGIEAPDFLLIGADDVLYAYDYDKDEVKILKELDQNPPFRVDALYKSYGDEYLLFNMEQGFLGYSLNKNEVYDTSFDISGSYCFWMDSKHRFWRSVYNKGLECYDTDGKLLTTYTTSNSGLNCNIVTCITERNGEIWAGTAVGGINIINPDNRRVTVLKKDPSNQNTFPSNSYISLFCDHNGNVWATTKNGEVVIFREFYAKTFSVYPSVAPNSITSMPVTGFIKNGWNDVLWIGALSNGINYLDQKRGKIISCSSTWDIGLESMAQLPDGRILAFVKGKGLYFFDKKSTTLYQDEDILGYLSSELRDSPVEVSLFTDMDGNIVILSDRIYVLNTHTWQSSKLPEDRLLQTKGMKRVTGGNNDYFFTRRFIYLWHSDQKRMEQVYDIGDDIVNSISMDWRGRFWIASDNGLFSLNLSTKEFLKVKDAPFESAQVLACDDQARVWVGADGYISVYLIDNDTFVLLNESDGVFLNNYTDSPLLITDDGYLYIGGNKGIVQIDLSMTFNQDDSPTLILQDVFVDDVKVDATSQIALAPNVNHIVVDLFAQSSNVLQKRIYKFKVNGPRGMEEIFSTTLPSQEFHYNHAGRYRISAACTTRSGEWTEWTDVLSFKIKPVWYLSLWFLLVLGAFIIALIIFVMKYSENRRNYQIRHKSDEDRVKFLLNVSHELKTPLTLIIGLLDRVMRSGRVDTENLNRLSSIRRQALRMRTLILTVLDAHKIEEGAAVLNAEPVQFNQWVCRIGEDFREEMESRGIQLHTDYDHSIGMVDIDAPKLENVLTNILINALKHSPNDTIVTLKTSRNDADGTLRVSVSDMGPGLGGVDMSHLFSRYYQGVTEKTGSGMGLAYANTIVKLHNGTMGAKDNPTGGAIFYFDLPCKTTAQNNIGVVQPVSVRAAAKQVAPVAAAVSSASAKSASTSVKSLSGINLLLVDDDNDLRQYISEELDDVVSKVLTAVDGVEALEVLSRENDIDIVVTDVNMPNMNGFELCRKIKSSPDMSHILVVMLTTRTDAESNRTGIACGADEYVTKPFDITTLTDTLSSLLQRK